MGWVRRAGFAGLAGATLLWVGAGCEREPAGSPSGPATPTVAAPSRAEAEADATEGGSGHNDAAPDEAISVTLPARQPRRGGSGGGSGGSGPGPVDDAIPSPEPGESLADCVRRCDSAQLSSDNRATCRLLCDSHHGPKTSAKTDALIGNFFGCFDQCENQTCEAGCAGQVARTSCAKGCLETLSSCLPACEGGGAVGRCSERCETSTRRCLGEC